MNYRCKHTVEAMRWTDTDENRELFYSWFDKHDAMFETRGPVVVLPEGDEAAEGEWVLRTDEEFIAMTDEQFVDTYEPFQRSPSLLDEMLASLAAKPDVVTPSSPEDFSQSFVDALCSGDE